MSDLTSKTVLRVNGNFLRLGWCSTQDAFISLMGEGSDGSPPAQALDIQYEYDENNQVVLETPKIFPYDWEYWMLLEPRRGGLDTIIHTSKNLIRVPTVICCPKYRKMPMREQRAIPSVIKERDGNKCAYTGVTLTHKTFSLDHVIPRSRGGKDEWNNLVSCHRDVNSKKSNKLNHEAGLKLINPNIPPPRKQPICNLIRGEFHIDHKWF